MGDAKKVRKYDCMKCDYTTPFMKRIRKTNSGYLCLEHYREKRLDHREFLKRDVIGIKKRCDLEKEWAEKRRLKVEREKANPKPKIPGEKLNRPSPKISSLGMYLKRDEKQVLYYKYIGQGYSSYNANKKVKESVDFLDCLVKKLRDKKKSEKEINVIFKEEFAKLGQ